MGVQITFDVRREEVFPLLGVGAEGELVDRRPGEGQMQEKHRPEHREDSPRGEEASEDV